MRNLGAWRGLLSTLASSGGAEMLDRQPQWARGQYHGARNGSGPLAIP